MEKSDGTEIVLTAAQLEKIIQGNSGVIYQKSITGGVDARKVPDSRCNSDTTLHDGQGNWGAPQNKWIASEGVYRGCGYARGILHFLTDVQCKTGSANGWYNFEISGLTLHGGAFECRTTGYLGGNGPVSKMSSCPYNELAFANSYCVGEKTSWPSRSTFLKIFKSLTTITHVSSCCPFFIFALNCCYVRQ